MRAFPAGFVAWLRQPTTVAGLSTAVGTGVALALHQVGLQAAAPLLAGAAMGMILPDNTAARTAAVTLARDVVAQVATGKVNIPTDVSDAVALAESVQAK
jgi:hypothetical protein